MAKNKVKCLNISARVYRNPSHVYLIDNWGTFEIHVVTSTSGTLGLGRDTPSTWPTYLPFYFKTPYLYPIPMNVWLIEPKMTCSTLADGWCNFYMPYLADIKIATNADLYKWLRYCTTLVVSIIYNATGPNKNCQRQCYNTENVFHSATLARNGIFGPIPSSNGLSSYLKFT